jgi:hypothetical protein
VLSELLYKSAGFSKLSMRKIRAFIIQFINITVVNLAENFPAMLP